MPLDYNEVWKKLDDIKSVLRDFNNEASKELELLFKNAIDVFKKDYKTLVDDLALLGKANGALPSPEYIYGIFRPFDMTFTNIKDMMDWAIKRTKGITICGTDGSQIYSTSDISIPISLVQAVCNINDHKGQKNSYRTETETEVLSPLDLLIELGGVNGPKQRIISQEPVNAKRFELEMNLLEKEMKNCIKNNTEQALFLSDGSLILSFLSKMSQSTSTKHLNALNSALKASETYRYPLVGYVDTSAAKDAVNMINSLSGSKKIEGLFITDAIFLSHYIRSKSGLNQEIKWGDRTCVFICDRNDEIYQKYNKKIAFFYIKLNNEMMARVEFPKWCLNKKKEENGKIFYPIVEFIADLMRAESVLGSGYPYIIDQCHHKAVIKGKERLKFLRLFQKFSEVNKLNLRIRNKARSKMTRF